MHSILSLDCLGSIHSTTYSGHYGKLLIQFILSTSFFKRAEVVSRVCPLSRAVPRMNFLDEEASSSSSGLIRSFVFSFHRQVEASYCQYYAPRNINNRYVKKMGYCYIPETKKKIPPWRNTNNQSNGGSADTRQFGIRQDLYWNSKKSTNVNC